MDRFDQAGFEPGLDEVLADPIVRLVMRRDRVEESDLRLAIKVARRVLASPDEVPRQIPAGERRSTALPREVDA